ncbi:anti-sigma-F factor Fin family protein [Paenibacillus sp.]|uniref:anti-sigma-F factor Fin family protein n=1 Tax=Paenibacillus sp. TaxID=58172 RepID=UPI002D453300|nr:anti-sigma-F factor Fin family protein [Paenibacillus sp.]HZG55804.1 anti-sigma-F factor Fin family protein [Paenibacillus sp.]
MSIRYVCKHCRMPLGEISGEGVTEARLGFHFLTPEERNDIITYDSNGGVTVKLVCDYCREALESHPELSLVSSPLQ